MDQTAAAQHQLLLQARSHDAGSSAPEFTFRLAQLIPDVHQHTCAARLVRGLLHPDPSQRPSVQQALDDDFLHTTE